MLRQLLIFVFLSITVVNCHASVAATDLKGAMIQRIATFIEWPSCGKKNIIVAVYDDASTGERFEHLYQGQLIGGNAVTVKSYTKIDDLDSLNNCDILYIGEASPSVRTRILQKLAKKGVLIIGNTRDDARSGVAVVLLEDGGHYRILVNPEAIKESNLHADYRLLKVAELVSGSGR